MSFLFCFSVHDSKNTKVMVKKSEKKKVDIWQVNASYFGKMMVEKGAFSMFIFFSFFASGFTFKIFASR